VEVLLGGLSSLFYGVADFLGGEGAKRVSAATIVVWSGLFSFPLLTIAAVIVGGDVSMADYGLGLAAGASGAMGLTTLFAGLARGRAAAVAPASAALGAMVPVAVAVVGGDRPSIIAWVGVVVAIPAIALSAWSEDEYGSLRAGFLYGTMAGLGFGGFTAIIGFTNADSNLLPLIASRAATIVVVVSLALVGIWKIRHLAHAPRGIIVGNGILDVSANVTLLAALRAGEFALAAVAASFYPAITVIMAKLVNGEHLRGRQVVGSALTLVALGLIAAG
jgi:drug/metabolite transporter (DMT)-like permease